MTGRYEQLAAEFRGEGDAEIARHSSRFFKTGAGEYGEGDAFLGIRVPTVRRYAKKNSSVSLGVVEQLLQSEYHEERLLSLVLLVEKYKSGSDGLQNEIFHLYLGNTDRINNWDLVDASAPYIPGAHLVNRDRQLLYELAKSDSLWERRIAIMSTYAFVRHNDFGTTLELSALLLNDAEDLIHKAVGWMLREVGNREHEAETLFLRKHYRIMPRTMLRYAIERFPERLRQAYLKGTA